jgi:putative heme transporter
MVFLGIASMRGPMSAISRCAPCWRAALVLSVAVGGLWTATHGIAGVDWAAVGSVLLSVSAWRLVVLAAIWICGLGIYSTVLSAALPGLGIRRSLLLNLSGSAVANVVPLGGAVATALNWRMTRAWGHSDGAFVAFCILTNALDVASKVLLPLAAVAMLVILSLDVPGVLWEVTAGCVGSLLVGLIGRAVALSTGATTGPTGRLRSSLHGYLRGCGERITRLLASRWHRLLPASVGYVAAQIALLFFALHSVGISPPLAVLLTAAAIERLGTLVPITPGGTGAAEAGTIAWLVAAGMDPAASVAGVLLYRAFLIAMDVPVGGVLLAGWAWLQRRAAPSRVGQTLA